MPRLHRGPERPRGLPASSLLAGRHPSGCRGQAPGGPSLVHRPAASGAAPPHGPQCPPNSRGSKRFSPPRTVDLVQRPLENASPAGQTGVKCPMSWRAVPCTSVFVSAARHKNSLSLGRRSDRACRADRDLRAAVGLAGRHLHAARRADGRRRPHVRMVGAARLVALMRFLVGIAIHLVLGCWPPRISCRS